MMKYKSRIQRTQ